MKPSHSSVPDPEGPQPEAPEGPAADRDGPESEDHEEEEVRTHAPSSLETGTIFQPVGTSKVSKSSKQSETRNGAKNTTEREI